MNEVPRNMHLNLCWSHPHFKQKLIQVDVLRSDRVSISIVPDKIQFDFNNSQHSRLEHIFEQHPLLGMNHLIIAILENFVAMDVFDVKVGIETEPFLVVALVSYLDQM